MNASRHNRDTSLFTFKQIYLLFYETPGTGRM
jgi:hypothetical protein